MGGTPIKEAREVFWRRIERKKGPEIEGKKGPEIEGKKGPGIDCDMQVRECPKGRLGMPGESPGSLGESPGRPGESPGESRVSPG